MRMQFSGYDETFRAPVVRSALKVNAYRQMVNNDRQGEEPLYRRVEEGGKSKREEG